MAAAANACLQWQQAAGAGPAHGDTLPALTNLLHCCAVKGVRGGQGDQQQPRVIEAFTTCRYIKLSQDGVNSMSSLQWSCRRWQMRRAMLMTLR